MRKGAPASQYMFDVKLKAYIYVPKFQYSFWINFNLAI